MAMIKCKECSHDVSDSASKCPSCGYKLKSFPWGMVLGIPIVLFIVFIAYGASIPQNESDSLAAFFACRDEMIPKGMATLADCHRIEAEIKNKKP